ncbi:FkbM family methyltransferase [Candidatus Parcubacteria bacterium]|nr:FkbM family methyltransferase [Candidatus Parcubacteria bacterium]
MVNIYDWPKIGPYLRKLRYKKFFSSLQPGEVAIDCGANVGGVTERMVKPGVIVYAFEPDKSAYGALKKKFDGVTGVTCINKAVSDHNGRERFYVNDRYSEDPEKWSTGSTLIAEKPHLDKSQVSEVEVVDLAEFIESLGKPVGLLKMDIEGEEVKVLNKLIDRGLIEGIRHIAVETHERFPTLKEPTERLKARIKSLGLSNIDLNWA